MKKKVLILPLATALAPIADAAIAAPGTNSVDSSFDHQRTSETFSAKGEADIKFVFRRAILTP